MLKRENQIQLTDAGETSAADLIAETLEMYEITQRDFARRIGVSQKHLSQVLNHKAFISATVALSIEKVTGIPAKLLLRLDTNYHLKHAEKPAAGSAQKIRSISNVISGQRLKPIFDCAVVKTIAQFFVPTEQPQ
ncbi:HigA family addiction module antitoxin [Lacticaseibacillus hegangensis]|uniref:HigA family addiction module antitoxin n=1 Tax=Lacticaseibacillus hegangensis TaxID=2486010 RepID=A0ABW4CYE5_9LACO|nr:HigA family addiction module antitoxin [Lacticaseibacillus hegangensis]